MKKKYYMQFADDSELCLSKEPKNMSLKKAWFWKNNLIFYEYFFVYFMKVKNH